MPGRGSYGPAGKWVHDRAQSILRNGDLKERYGEKKAKQVAYAIATQQGHRVGKSLKSHRTAQGVRTAKAKLSKPVKEYQKTASGFGIGIPLKEWDPGVDKGYVTNVGLGIPHGPTVGIRTKRGFPVSENIQIAPGIGLGFPGPHIGLTFSERDKAHEQRVAERKKARAAEKKEKKAAAVDEAALLAFFDEMEKAAGIKDLSRRAAKRVGEWSGVTPYFKARNDLKVIRKNLDNAAHIPVINKKSLSDSAKEIRGLWKEEQAANAARLGSGSKILRRVVLPGSLAVATGSAITAKRLDDKEKKKTASSFDEMEKCGAGLVGKVLTHDLTPGYGPLKERLATGTRGLKQLLRSAVKRKLIKTSGLGLDLRKKGPGNTTRPPFPTEASKAQSFKKLRQAQKVGTPGRIKPPEPKIRPLASI